MNTATAHISSRLIGTGIAAQIIGVTPETIRRWVEAGLLDSSAYVRLPSGRHLFRRESIEAIRAGALNEAKS